MTRTLLLSEAAQGSHQQTERWGGESQVAGDGEEQGNHSQAQEMPVCNVPTD